MTIAALLLVHFSLSETAHSNQTKEYLSKISNAAEHSKIAACLSIIRNSLNTEAKNEKLSKAISSTRLDKGKYYDKAIATMLYHCVKKIKKEEMEIAISSKNILTPIKSLYHLIDIDYSSITTVEKTKEESDLFNEISNAGTTQDTINLNPEDEVGFLWFKLEQVGNLSYYFALTGIALFVIIVCGGMYMIHRNQKEKEKNKKTKKKKK